METSVFTGSGFSWKRLSLKCYRSEISFSLRYVKCQQRNCPEIHYNTPTYQPLRGQWGPKTELPSTGRITPLRRVRRVMGEALPGDPVSHWRKWRLTPWRANTRKGSGIWSQMPNQGFSAVLCIVVWFNFNSTLRLWCFSKTVAIEIPTFLTVTNNELSDIHATQSLKLFVRRFTQLGCIRSWKVLPWIGWI